MHKIRIVLVFMVIFSFLVIISCEAQAAQQYIIGRWFLIQEYQNEDLTEGFLDELFIVEFSANQAQSTHIGSGLPPFTGTFEYHIVGNRMITSDGELTIEFRGQNSIRLISDYDDEVMIGTRITGEIDILSGNFVNSTVRGQYVFGYFESLEFLDRTNIRITSIDFSFPPFYVTYMISGYNLILSDSSVLEILSDSVIVGSLAFTDEVIIFVKQ